MKISKLERAIEVADAEVRALENRRLAISASYSAATERLRMFTQAHSVVVSELMHSPNTESAAAFVESSMRSQAARAGLSLLSLDVQAGAPDKRFRDENPQYRDALSKLCDALLTKARQVHTTLMAAAERRLTGKNFDSEEIGNDPECKRARREIERLEQTLERVRSDPPEIVWRVWALALLGNE